MDKLSVMHAFRRIVERGSFARAAEDLGVSPALLSREIKLLEESLGTTLLTRTTRSMSLTDAGRLYYDEATGILDAVVGVETRIRDGAGAVRGHLKVNASSSFGQTVIAPILPPLLVAAALAAQFSAAIADTSGSGGLFAELTSNRVTPRMAYALLTAIGLLLTWTANVFEIISYASRAFALYYALQALIAVLYARERNEHWRSAGFAALVLLGVAIVVFGQAVEG